MPKRRRERDRPKAGPEAAYNPNKRVLLSYGDEDEEEEAVVPDTTRPTELTNYQIDEYPSEHDEEPAADAVAGAQQDEDVVESPQEPETSSTQADPRAYQGDIKKNQATNQFPALGVASYQWDEDGGDEHGEEDADSETQEAMAYLKAVRSERQNMPEILSAAATAQQDDYDYDEDSWDPEEAYIGAPAPTPATEEDLTDPQVVFTKALLARFAEHRKQLHLPATLNALQALTDSHPISFPRGNNKAYAEWFKIVTSTASQPAQVRSLEPEAVFDLLALIQKHYLVKGKNVKKITSSWIWSLLARLEDVGNMTNDEVYPLRELGKRVVYLQYSFTNPEVADQLETMGQAGTSSSHVNPDEIDLEEDLKAMEPQQPQEPQKVIPLKEAFVTDNTRATLDMILVIVGEVFGQRDLLEFRQPWKTAAK